MGQGFFEMVRDAFEGFVTTVPGRHHSYVHGRGIKVWFDDATREHYEAQLIRVDDVEQLEIGFHSEHPKAPMNDAVLKRMVAAETEWRPALGDEAEAGHFIGRTGWRRISEVWPVPEGEGESEESVDSAIDTAARLADYVVALEPTSRG